MSFTIEVWNAETERFDCFAEGYSCAKKANELVDKLMDKGYFARVTVEESAQ